MKTQSYGMPFGSFSFTLLNGLSAVEAARSFVCIQESGHRGKREQLTYYVNVVRLMREHVAAELSNWVESGGYCCTDQRAKRACPVNVFAGMRPRSCFTGTQTALIG